MFKLDPGASILALDSAKVTGVCEGIPGAKPLLETVNFARPHDDEFDIWARAQTWFIRRILASRPGLILLEGLVPQFDKTLQCGIFSSFGGIARAKQIPILVAPVQTWRAAILGDGKLKKEVAKARALSICGSLGWSAPDHNAAEAAMQWLYACSKVEPKSVPRIPLFMRGAA
jgi:hypothetical protein